MCTNTPAPVYRALKEALGKVIPLARPIDDPLRPLAYGTGASFYRLIPRCWSVSRARRSCSLYWPSVVCAACRLPFGWQAPLCPVRR